MVGVLSLLCHHHSLSSSSSSSSSYSFSSSKPNCSLKSLSPLFPALLIIPLKSSNKTHIPNVTRVSSLSPGKVPVPARSRRKTHNLNLEVSPHRAVAAVRLLRIEQGGAFADLLIEKGKNSAANEMDYVERTLGFRTRDLDDRDIRLVTDVVGGAVRWRRYLDHLIMSLCNEERTFRDMEPLLLQILRIGFYEIIKLDMPSYAVVDENVKLAKVALRLGAGNLVNGILRKLVLLKETDSLPLPKLEGDDRTQARALATIHSHPVWMVRRWIKYLGREEAVRLMNWNNSNPSFSLRVNTWMGYTRSDLVARLNFLKVPHELSTYIDDFVRIQTGMQIVIQAGLLREGLCSVQDESAGLVVSVLDPQPGETIIDCCAAPGGKTLFMASRMSGQDGTSTTDWNQIKMAAPTYYESLFNHTDYWNVFPKLKLVWKILTSTSLWATWMRQRYVQNFYFWETHHILDSGTWKWISNQKHQAMRFIKRRIGNGETSSLWFDPWLSEGRLADLIDRDAPYITHTLNWKVSHLIHLQQWRNLIPALNNYWNAIMNTQFINHEEDIWMWTGNSSGNFSLNSAWDNRRHRHDNFEYYDIVWFPTSSPKVSCCILKGILNRLPTRAMLFKFNIINTEVCVLCGHF